MGKRNLDAVVVLSSDDEGKVYASKSGRRGKAKSEPGRNAARKKSRNSRRAPASGVGFLASEFDLQEHAAGFLPSDLCEDLLTFTSIPVRRNIESNSCKSGENNLWVDKYKPHTLAELAVHWKSPALQVDEVKLWLKERLTSQKATIYVVASNLGAEICEWKTPTPTLWQEYHHSIESGDICFPLQKELLRFPLKMDSPETIFHQAHGEASQVLDFLHENGGTLYVAQSYGKLSIHLNSKRRILLRRDFKIVAVLPYWACLSFLLSSRLVGDCWNHEP